MNGESYTLRFQHCTGSANSNSTLPFTLSPEQRFLRALLYAVQEPCLAAISPTKVQPQRAIYCGKYNIGRKCKQIEA
jgi:hypothetical protein